MKKVSWIFYVAMILSLLMFAACVPLSFVYDNIGIRICCIYGVIGFVVFAFLGIMVDIIYKD